MGGGGQHREGTPGNKERIQKSAIPSDLPYPVALSPERRGTRTRPPTSQQLPHAGQAHAADAAQQPGNPGGKSLGLRGSGAVERVWESPPNKKRAPQREREWGKEAEGERETAEE